jgi:uncharacterized membrane protein
MMGLAGNPLFAAHSVASIGLPLLFLSLVVGSTVLVVLYAAKPTSPVSARAARVDVAVEIVRGRFARGEIDADEYNRLVTGLTRTD